MSKRLVFVFILSALLPLGYRFYSVYHCLFAPELPSSYFKLNGTVGSCQVIEAEDGRLKFCEDATLWKDVDGKAIGILASCDPGRREWNTFMGPMSKPEPGGDLWYLGASSDTPQRLPLIGFPLTSIFHPIGVAVFPATPQAPAVLYVVNHGLLNSTIEVFGLIPPTSNFAPMLIYQRTITHRSLTCPNAVYPISPTALLVSQDHMFTQRLPYPLRSFLPMVETLLALPLGTVDLVEFSGDAIQVTTAARLAFPNGIAISPAGDELAVASSSGATVHFYRIPVGTPRNLLPLAPLDVIRTPFAPDNLRWASDGKLYAAGPPGFIPLIAVSENRAASAPSWAISISSEKDGGIDSAPYPYTKRVRAPKTRSMTTVYQSNGGQDGFGTSATAVVDELAGVMWMVGLFETGVLRCKI